ncbi:MAG: EamA family transporter [Desulfobacteraceae bacterium 4572_88]|nr:MAG: EamA family transporter [Desulfobacteraceae bacterium 4572_88]
MKKTMVLGSDALKNDSALSESSKTCKANFLLLLTAAIWGSAFVAQRMGMDHVGPFTFNGVRFALGAMILLPLTKWRISDSNGEKQVSRIIIWGGALAGMVMFGGATLQQIGLVYTTAGKAAFITGLYVIIVPLLGLFWGDKPGWGGWIGVTLAAVGLYFLSITESFTFAPGDLWVLIGAFFWAVHVLILSRFAPDVLAVFAEPITFSGLRYAAIPILYGGVMSVGIAYTMQVVAQKDASPVHAAIILSLEGFFAAIAGWFILEEVLTLRAIMGCALMLTGMLIAQLQTSESKPHAEGSSHFSLGPAES